MSTVESYKHLFCQVHTSVYTAYILQSCQVILKMSHKLKDKGTKIACTLPGFISIITKYLCCKY